MPTHPPVDRELAEPLRRFLSLVPGGFTAATVPALRAAAAAGAPTDEVLARYGAITVERRSTEGHSGQPDVPLLVCRPAGATTAAPVVYFVHGGGMVLGDETTGLGDALDWVEQLGVVVVSVGYRLAPEHPHPVPVEDCWSGLVWTVEHAADLVVDPSRVVVAGASAGGGLAAALTLLSRGRGGPALAGQLLMQPMLDDRNDTPSSHELLDGDTNWDRTANLTGWTALLGERRGGVDVPAAAAPARAADLSRLPPAFIDVGSMDVLRDEDVDYAVRLWRAGGQAELHVWPGGFHGFDVAAPTTALAGAARAARLGWLQRLLQR